MKLSLTNLALLLILLIFSGVESFDRYVEYTNDQFWLLSGGLLILALIARRLRKIIFPTLLFFLLLHIFRPVNLWFTDIIGANFNGTYYLLPCLSFIGLILLVPSIKSTIDWWRKESFSKTLIIQMILAVVLGSVAMFIYLKANPNSLDRFVGMLPDGSILMIVLMGVLYAGLNASVEELIFRGMVWNGLEKIMPGSWLIGFSQAAIFGLSHYWGLPGGWSGVLMTFVLSLFLGYVRIKSGGILGCILVHFGLNLSQYFMLYWFK